MATIDKIEQELTKADVRLDEAVKKLEEWEQRKYGGEKLNELEEELIVGNFNEAERGKREGWRNRLLGDKERLEKKVDNWEKQVEEWGKRLREFGGGEGNEQIA